MSNEQPGFVFNTNKSPALAWARLDLVIVDRGSKYSVTAGRVGSDEDIRAFMKCVYQDRDYQQATHNSYAARFRDRGMVIDRKADDGEDGAGMVILRELRRVEMVDVICVVTRWFGGTMLYADRFKHLRDGARMGIEACLKV